MKERKTRRLRKPGFTILALVLCLTMLPSGMGKVHAAKKKVRVTKTLTLTKGQTAKIKVTGTKKKKKFSSKNKKIATVTKKGVVKAKKVGKTTIRVKIGKKTYKTKVIVKEAAKKTQATQTTQAECKVLFVGNSKTYVGDIPGKFKSLAAAAGHTVEADSVTAGGYSLKMLAENASYSASISAKAYDYVILQEQTVICKFGTEESDHYKGAKAVVDLVRKKNPNCKVVIRQMWVYKDSVDAEKNYAYEAAEQVASLLGTSLISRDGKAMYDADANLVQVISDDRHQNEAGAYLCACCVYKAIYGSVPGSGYTAGLGDTAAGLQQIAAKY